MDKTVKVTLWGRKLELEVVFDCYEGEEVLPSQVEALEKITSSWHVVEESKAALVAYCLDRAELKEDTISSDFFSHVTPASLYVPRETKDRVVALMCEFDGDPEEGLAVVFSNESLETVEPQSSIL